MLAVICDGSLMNDGRCRFHLLKERKKIELRKILTEAGLKWKENPCAKPGYSNFYTTIPRLEKHFSKYWYNCSQRQLQLICDNILMEYYLAMKRNEVLIHATTWMKLYITSC